MFWAPTAGAASGENIFSAVLNPNQLPAVSGMSGGIKLQSMAALFQYYKFKSVKYRLQCANTQANPAATAETRAVLGYAAINQSAPTSFSGTLDALHCSEVSTSTAVVGVNTQHLPSVPRWQSIPSRLLNDQNVKWWKSEVSASVDDELEYQGVLVLAALTNVASFTVRPFVEIRVVCEFKNFTGTNFVPMVQGLDDGYVKPNLASTPVCSTASEQSQLSDFPNGIRPTSFTLLRSGSAIPRPLQGRN